MVSFQVWYWVIMAIFRWGHSSRGHFDLVPVTVAEGSRDCLCKDTLSECLNATFTLTYLKNFTLGELF